MLEAIVGKNLYVMTHGCIASTSRVRQLPHSELHAASLPADGVAVLVFAAVSIDNPNHDVCAQFVAMSVVALPDAVGSPEVRIALVVVCTSFATITLGGSLASATMRVT